MHTEPPVRNLILLPGMDGTATLFDPFIGCLPAPLQAHPIAFPSDRPLSYSELASFIRAQLLSEPFILLAESFSTPPAIQIAATDPAGLKALILVAGFVANPASSRRRQIVPLLPLLRRLSPPAFLIKRYLLGRGAPLSLVQEVKQVISSVQPGVFASRLRSIVDCAARAELAQITVPILYLQANQDRIVPPRCLDEILAIKPDIIVNRIDGPHLLLQREPRQCAALVADFIQNLESIR